MSGRTRELLAADLEPLLPAFTVYPDPRALGEIDPAKRGWVQVIRTKRTSNPIAPQAQFVEQLQLWVATPLQVQPEAENDLDDSLDLVRAALESLSSTSEITEERLQHPEGKHAYRVTVTYITDKE